MTDAFEAVIVGMGPAGMAAAIELCRQGAQVAIVDENPQPGGQVYRRFAKEFTAEDERSLGVNYAKGKKLIEEFLQVGKQCAVLNDTHVWGGFADNQLSLRHEDKIALIKYNKLLLAEGASERPSVFPGWTLPGVMTLGGLQKLVSRDFLLPGKRFLIAGASPLLIPVAAEVLRAGGEIAGVCTVVPLARFLKLLPELAFQKEILFEAIRHAFEIVRRNAPVFSGYTVVSCAGENRIREARIAKLDADGRIAGGSMRTFEIDILAASNGILPMSRLGRQLGCRHEYDPEGLCWKVKTGPLFRSSQPNIYAAGDSHAIGGRDLAEWNGRMAGLEIAKDLGRISADEFNRRLSERARSRERLVSYVSTLQRVLSRGVNQMVRQDLNTIVCRCEQVSLGDVLSGIERGYRTMNEIKRTRVGMGLCQGRVCESVVTEIMLRKGIPIEEIGHFGIRPPIAPIPIALLEGYATQDARESA
jgi:D-hydroxyproline dehydrogenase subunit alpha